ncbi:TMV resistance protein N-like [Mercurialis annua]|uniref:TMV resistance protein N-like n=1 Tax=Mercurialis annua TaxID=3986 RepID=UPI00215EAA8D|nr:TMV resistance protein N-like [Mercurialis annua]
MSALVASSSCTACEWKYDAFISFRGRDTRDNFTNYLYKQLYQKGIETFIDNKLNRGEEITPELLKAIQESMVSVIVFSQNYADSPWCLEELVHIMECKKAHGQVVLPVFYRVDPSEVEEQKGEFGLGFERAKKQANGDMRLVKKWIAALKDAANLSGWDSSVVRPDSKLIDEIVNHILKKLKHTPSSDTEGLIGIDSSLAQVEKLLNIGSADVRTIGLWGMGGIGKTTIAGVIFNRISALFDSYCFLADVRKESETTGLPHLQESLFSMLLEDDNLNMHMLSTEPSSIKTRLHRKKVLVVLDDVNNSRQLELLAGVHWYGPGSRIIITTRDRHLLVSHDVNFVYEIRDLNEEHALELFSRYAFKQKHRTDEFTELSMHAIDYCKGLPLALKVLGSSLYGRSEIQWTDSLNRLEKHFNKDIQQTLRISFDGLEESNKSMFLDVACYFRGQDKDYVAKLLKSFGFYPESGISELIDHSLVTVFDNTLGMHDLLQDMGREIVRQQSLKDPGKRSRLWDHEEAVQVLMEESGTEHVECMVIDLSKTDERKFSVEAFMKLKNLRLLDVHGAYGDRKIHLSGDFDILYYKLKCLCWEGYPLKYLPSNFNPKKIIMIEMPRSSIKQLWDGKLEFKELQFIDLSHSQELTETPDFTGVPNLETLILEGCTSLSKVHSSIGSLKKLVLLNLKGCNCLRSLPISIEWESLNTLVLSGCSKLEKFPEIVGNMGRLSKLGLEGTAIANLPHSFENLTGLLSLSLRNCKNLERLPDNINSLKYLKNLDLFGCSKLKNLPESLGYLKCLEKLDVGKTSVRQPPSSIGLLRNLIVLSFHGSKPVARQWPYKLLSMFGKNDAPGLSLPSLTGLHSLTEIDLSDCNLSEDMIPVDFDCLSSLKVVNLSRNIFVNLPASISRLPQLRYLYLDDCVCLKALRKLPSTIHEISADNCASLEMLSSSEVIADKWNWPIFYFTNCFKLAVNRGNDSSVFEFLRSHLQSLSMSQLQDASSSCRFDVIVPGTELPNWFSNQITGSSIIVQLCPNWYNEKFKGLAVCVLFAIHEDPQLLSEGVVSDIAIYCKMEVSDHTATSSFKFLIYRVPSLQSDHLWMGFHSRIEFDKPNWLNKCRVLKVSFESSSPCMKVKKCGVRMVYDKDEDEGSHPCQNLSLDYQVIREPMVAEEIGKLKRRHESYNEAGSGGSKSSDKEERPYSKRFKEF